MKALHLTFRFGEDVVGGAEYLLYMTSRKLVELGTDVDIYTTKTVSLTPISRSGVRWDNTIKNKHDIHNNIDIYRYTTYSIPKVAAIVFDYLIQNQLDREEADININNTVTTASALGTGWYPLEIYDNLKMRWTKKNASFFINDDNVSSIFFEASCPRCIPVTISINDNSHTNIRTSRDWQRYEFPVDEENEIFVKINLDRTWHPIKDLRHLGIAIKNVGYISNGEKKYIPLENDYINTLRKQNNALFLDTCKNMALKRPKIYNYLFMGLRGPLSPSLLYDLSKQIKNYDIIFSQMMPFNTINYGVYMGKKYGIPSVVLPLFHPDDSFYHWGHYYDSIKSADMVLTLSDYTKTMIIDPLDVPCEVIGGGIHPHEFEDHDISGKRFRDKFKLENIPIILFVGRKSYPKRYDLLIKAVDTLNNEHAKCILIIIGPDEDRIPITSKNVLYLGKTDRKILLDAYDACDVFAMMSESESFGIVYCEAWMRKKPVIGNKYCGPVSTLIEDGKDGFLCDEHDLAVKIEILLSDENLRCAMGKHGYKKTMNKYTWNIIGNKVKKIYEKLC